MWIDKIKKLTDEIEFSPGTQVIKIESAEQRLGVKFPQSLRGLLEASDGLVGEYGLGLVWPLERIQNDNIEFRANTDFR